MLNRLKNFPYLPLALLLFLVVRLLFWGVTWIAAVALLVGLAWFSLELVRWLMAGKVVVRLRHHRSSEAKPATETPQSLVFFLSEERAPEENMIRDCVSHALGIVFDPANPDAEYFVIEIDSPAGDAPLFPASRQFMVRVPQGLFSVIASNTPYVSNPAAFARESIRDKRLRQAVENHRAWISVDSMDQTEGGDSDPKAYEAIGKILASMAGPDCLAVFSPELQRCNEFDPSLIDELSGSDPLRIFDGPTFEPIIEIAENDPRMQAAIDEALQRWPEFVSAFRDRSDEDTDRFIVKAEFREGSKAEFMWVAVTAIDRDMVHGILTNDPLDLLDVHRGAAVSVELDRLNDWIYPTPDGSIEGGFTLDVLAGDE